MSGVGDLPFRRIASRLGAGLVVSEMVASEELAKARRDVVRRAMGEGLYPFVVQLVGREALWMAEATRIAQGYGADLIDINMGCPAREVTGKLSGSALMRDLDHAVSLIEAVVEATDLPVTLKMRLGWDRHTLNAPDLAQRAEAVGVRMITVHARTRCQFFKDHADWSAVRHVKNAVRIPVVVNGDIQSVEHARRALLASGADAVMVGRGACGAPWLPGRIAAALATGQDPGPPPWREQALIAGEHYEAMLEHHGRELGVRNARKHIASYLEASGRAPEAIKVWRGRLCRADDPAAVRAGLAAFYSDPEPAELAA
jgi:nifR3 family TIM-barrel protein